MLNAQHYSNGDNVENKPANVLVSLEKTLNGISPSESGKEVAGISLASSSALIAFW